VVEVRALEEKCYQSLTTRLLQNKKRSFNILKTDLDSLREGGKKNICQKSSVVDSKLFFRIQTRL
jgi:hypothetical protein